jgi:hypothetical protein
MDFYILGILVPIILWFNFCLYFTLNPKIKNSVFFVLLLAVIFYVIFSTGYFSLMYLLGSLVIIAFSIIGLYINRVYIYLMALLLLILTSIFLSIKLDGFAEILAVNVYFLLLFGVLKDVLYEKIFKS